MLCDPGDRYLDTYYNHEWLVEKKFDLKPYQNQLEVFYEKGSFT
jgi:cysteine synthase A